MPDIFVIIGLVVLVLVVALIVFIHTRPLTYRIERSATIQAHPDVVFALIDDFHEWQQWSPWEKLDPNLKRTFEGPQRGVGAVYSWVGNSKAGEGRMTIQESKPRDVIAIKLEFLKPFAAVCQATFKFAPSDGGTQVAWTMDGTNNFMAKAFTLFVSMDKMIGKDFEQGLANLDAAAQARAREGAASTAATV